MKKVVVILLLCAATSLMAGSFPLFSDTVDLNVGSYRVIKFRVTPDMADSTFISGQYSTDPVPTKIEFILLTELGYRRGWEGRGEIDTLGVFYGTNGVLNLEVPDFGDFVLVVSNRGNKDPVNFIADLSVSFRGSGITYDSLPFGLTLLMSILAIGIVLAAVLLTVKRTSSSRG